MNFEASEQKIRDLLAQKSWRKARDEAKELCKIDRGRYLRLLIEANVGLAREMLAKKLVSEARQVIAYLKTIAPRSAWEALETEAALKSGDYSAAAAGALRALEQGGAPLAQPHGTVDQLVLAFQMPPGPASPAASQAAAIHKALEAICAEEYERAAELIRPIPHDSAFRHWKLFIKGLAAFHRGDPVRALRFLSELPEDGAPGRAALPYLHWLGQTDGRARFDKLPGYSREFVAALAGASDQARMLVRAEQLWREGQPREMYELVHKSIEGFPSENPDWVGTLTDFCLNCLFILPPAEREEYAGYFHELVEGRHTRPAREAKMLWRVLSMALAFDSMEVYVNMPWEKFLSLRTRLDGPNPRIDSLAYEWLGSILAGHQPSSAPASMPPTRLPRMPDPKGAVRAFQNSIAADPGNLEAQLSLAYMLGRLRRNGERNRLLDSLAKRFPENKHVLLLAADRCIHRKAYVKGLGLLARALDRDRLDPAIPNAIVIARFLQACELFRRGRRADAHQALDAAEVHAVDQPDDFLRGRWGMLLRRGVFDLLYGDGTRGHEDLAQARAAAPSLEAYLLTGHIAWQLYGSSGSDSDPFDAEFRGAFRTQAGAAKGVLLLRILEFWSGRQDAPPLYTASAMVRDYLEAASRRPFTRAEALDLIERIPPLSPQAAAARTFIKALLKKDGGDPLLRLYDLRYQDGPFLHVPSRRKKLNAIMKEAVRRKEDQAIQAIRHELDKLDQLPPPRPFAPPFDEFDDEEFEPREFDYADMLEDMAGSMNPRERRDLAEIREVLRNASEQEIRRLRKTLPRGIPPEMFELLLEIARNESPESAAGPKRASEARKPPKRNPAQKEFFDL